VTSSSRRNVAELRAQAAAYRGAAQNTRIAKVRDGLLKIADRYDTLADQREREQLGGWPVGDKEPAVQTLCGYQ
jgi:hypothetical protein